MCVKYSSVNYLFICVVSCSDILQLLLVLVIIRKKRLTSHWRNYIRPLMWRCKWAELKIKQFESQALKYNKMIAARNMTKHLASNQPIPEGFSSRSMPYIKRRQRKLMKRRKRARIEDTADADLYMSQHVLCSYNGIFLSVAL